MSAERIPARKTGDTATWRPRLPHDALLFMALAGGGGWKQRSGHSHRLIHVLPCHLCASISNLDIHRSLTDVSPNRAPATSSQHGETRNSRSRLVRSVGERCDSRMASRGARTRRTLATWLAMSHKTQVAEGLREYHVCVTDTCATWTRYTDVATCNYVDSKYTSLRASPQRPGRPQRPGSAQQAPATSLSLYQTRGRSGSAMVDGQAQARPTKLAVAVRGQPRAGLLLNKLHTLPSDDPDLTVAGLFARTVRPLLQSRDLPCGELERVDVVLRDGSGDEIELESLDDAVQRCVELCPDGLDKILFTIAPPQEEEERSRLARLRAWWSSPAAEQTSTPLSTDLHVDDKMGDGPPADEPTEAADEPTRVGRLRAWCKA